MEYRAKSTYINNRRIHAHLQMSSHKRINRLRTALYRSNDGQIRVYRCNNHYFEEKRVSYTFSSEYWGLRYAFTQKAKGLKAATGIKINDFVLFSS